MIHRYSVAAASALAAAWLLQAGAAVAPETAERLGRDLTPVGAEKAGNDAGTIPAWRGGLHRPDAGDAQRDPYVDDEVRLTITADNIDRHRERLTAGQAAMFERYPDYRMRVYPSRRSATFPDHVLAATRDNATRAGLNGVDGLEGAAVGFPFPIPGSAAEVIWNHKLRWRTQGVEAYYNSAVVTGSGDYKLLRQLQRIKVPYSARGFQPADLERNTLFYVFQETLAPAQLAGAMFLMKEVIDPAQSRRRVWLYVPGERRVRSAPNMEHDQPSTGSEGLRTVDQTDVFNGSLARYDWELRGKREIYIPYNAYRLDSRSLDYDDVVRAHHINQDLARYELHRVWVVDAHLREDASHRYARRTFYVDEDSWQIVLVDVYDHDGRLWQLQEAHPKSYYQVPATTTALEAIYDLKSGRYVVVRLDNDDPTVRWRQQWQDQQFTPSALRARGTR